jgi:hypothetical protein
LEHNILNNSLIADLNNIEKEVEKVKCKVGRILDHAIAEEKDALIKAVELIRESNDQGKNKVYSSVWLSKVLRKNGYPISVSTVQRHVNKECYCEQFDK